MTRSSGICKESGHSIYLLLTAISLSVVVLVFVRAGGGHGPVHLDFFIQNFAPEKENFKAIRKRPFSTFMEEGGVRLHN